jgi:hypothetical protein
MMSDNQPTGDMTMTNHINLHAINADIQAIDTMFQKYQIDMENIFDCDASNVEIPAYYRLENLIDDLEELGCKAHEFSNGFYKLLIAAREECERKHRVFTGFTLSIEGETELYNFVTTAKTTTEILLKLGGSISGKKVLDITHNTKSNMLESDRNDAIKSAFGDDYGGCKVCNEFNTSLWACTGACELAILACDKHSLYTVIQTGRYKGDDIKMELMRRTWDELNEIMTCQDQHGE